MDAKIKTVKIELTEQEHTELKNQANQKKCSLKYYTKTKLMDTDQGIEILKQEIMQTMPRYYHEIEKVEDPQVRSALNDIGGAICRFLK